MTIKTYEFIPGSIASLLYVRPPGLTGDSIPCVYMSKERGVVVGRFEKPLAEYGWPMEVDAEINRHFDTVFKLPHEDWKGNGLSPRARYCDEAKSWKIDIELADYVVMDEHTFGYLGGRDVMVPMARSVDGHDWKNGAVSTIGSTVRPATREDFDRFRVSMPKWW